MCAGDWDLDGSSEILCISPGGEMLVIDEFGETEETLLLPGASEKRFRSRAVQWAEIEQGQSAIIHYPGGWPDELPVVGEGGKLLWNCPTSGFVGFNSAVFVDIDGDTDFEILTGFNGGGFQLVSSQGEAVWAFEETGNVWKVAGINSQGGRPGVALCATGVVHVYDALGKRILTLPNKKHFIAEFAAAEMDSAGTRQVLAVWRAFAGKFDRAVATDLEGNILWAYPVEAYVFTYDKSPILAVDLTGDGVKEWIIHSRQTQWAVLDTAGRLLLEFERPVANCRGWTAFSREGKPGLAVFCGKDEMAAYSVEGPVLGARNRAALPKLAREAEQAVDKSEQGAPETGKGNALTPPFRAVVRAAEAEFIFSISPRSDWEWNAADTRDNRLEYGWGVEVSNGPDTYEFGFSKFKYPGSSPARGDLGALLDAGQMSLWERKGPSAALVNDGGIAVACGADTIVVTVEGKENVERLFSTRPERVVFKMNIPGEQPISKPLRVDYGD
jgi:hypothetical protein